MCDECLNGAHDQAQVVCKTLYVKYLVILVVSQRFVPNMGNISWNINVDFAVLLPPSFVLVQHTSAMPAITTTKGSQK